MSQAAPTDAARGLDASQRQRMDALTLRLIRSGDPQAATGLQALCLDLAGAGQPPGARPFWTVAAAFFEALVLNPPDAAAKRLVAQTLLAYISQASRGAVPRAELLAQLQQASERAVSDAQDRIRLVGDLQVEMAAYNQFLNEADEASRRLLVELSEWTIESDRPVFGSTIGWAQQLAEGGSRVGFDGLAEFADALAQALRHVQPYQPLVADDAALFMATAEEVRRLLHQFAAGFLKSPQAELVLALRQRCLALAPPQPERAWAGLLSGLSRALRQCAARPDNLSARAEVTRLIDLADGLARQLGAAACVAVTQRMQAQVLQLGQEDEASGLMTQLQQELQALQAAGSVFFTTA